MFKSERFLMGLQLSGFPQDQPGLLQAENVDFTQPGLARLRDGDELLTAETTDLAQVSEKAHAVFHRGKELLLCDGEGSLFSYNRCLELWQRVGNWTPARLRQRPVISNGQNFRQVDAQTIGDCTLIVGEFAGRIDFSVIGEDGQMIVPPTTIAAVGQDVRCAKAQDWVLVIWTDGYTGMPGTDVTYAIWRPTNPSGMTIIGTFPNPLGIHTMPALGFPPLYDLRGIPGSNTVAVLTAPVATGLAIHEWTELGTVANSATYNVGGVSIGSVSIWPNSNGTFRVAWWDTGVPSINSALVSFGGGILEQATAAPVLDDSSVFATYFAIAVASAPTLAEPTRAIVVTTSRYSTAPFSDSFKLDTWETYGATLTQLRYQWHTTLQSMAWVRDSQVFVTAAFDPNPTSPLVLFAQLQNYVVGVLDVQSGEVISRAMRGYSVTGFVTVQDPVTPDILGELVRIVSPRSEATIVVGGAPLEVEYYVYFLDHHFEPRAQRAELLDDVAHAAHAGFIRAYDGRTAYEHDWHVLPDLEFVSVDMTGSLVAGGTYTVALCWEWFNHAGDLHRSAPVLYSMVLPGGFNLLNIFVRSLGWTEREDVRLVAWRSLNGDASVLYREGAVDNDPNARFLQVVIERSDVEAQEMELLDQQPVGDVLAHDPTPATDFCAVVQGRLWTRDPENGWLIRYSLPAYEGFAIGWNSLQAVAIQGQEDCTAVADQDGQILLLTNDGAYVIVGNGPELNGRGQLFSVPQRVPLETGAVSFEGVVRLATGIAYGSVKGVRILARTRTDGDLGRLVERSFLEEGQTVVAAVFDPESRELVLLDDAPENSDTATLRLHLATGRWARDRGRQGRDLSLSHDGELIIVRLDGRVIRRVPGRVVDPELADMVMTVQLPWGRTTDSLLQPCFDGVLAQITGNYLGPHRLACQLYRDYSIVPQVDGFVDLVAPPDDYCFRQFWALTNSSLRSMGVSVSITANGSKGVELVAVEVQMESAGLVGPLPPEREEWTPIP
jgi:hypothetical protein